MSSSAGVISDTHGILRPEAIEFLKTCDLILHAGDIGSQDVFEELGTIAPVFAVRGNMDHGSWAKKLSKTEVVEVEAMFFYLIHNLYDLDVDPVAAGFDAVVSGHSHQPKRYEKDGVLYFNPGSAGPKRFRNPVSIGRIRIRAGRIDSEIIRRL